MCEIPNLAHVKLKCKFIVPGNQHFKNRKDPFATTKSENSAILQSFGNDSKAVWRAGFEGTAKIRVARRIFDLSYSNL